MVRGPFRTVTRSDHFRGAARYWTGCGTGCGTATGRSAPGPAAAYRWVPATRGAAVAGARWWRSVNRSAPRRGVRPNVRFVVSLTPGSPVCGFSGQPAMRRRGSGGDPPSTRRRGHPPAFRPGSGSAAVARAPHPQPRPTADGSACLRRRARPSDCGASSRRSGTCSGGCAGSGRCVGVTGGTTGAGREGSAVPARPRPARTDRPGSRGVGASGRAAGILGADRRRTAVVPARFLSRFPGAHVASLGRSGRSVRFPLLSP